MHALRAACASTLDFPPKSLGCLENERNLCRKPSQVAKVELGSTSATRYAGRQTTSGTTLAG